MVIMRAQFQIIFVQINEYPLKELFTTITSLLTGYTVGKNSVFNPISHTTIYNEDHF